jgi:serine phosphatase RsbU (regulator of sigma subunit)
VSTLSGQVPKTERFNLDDFLGNRVFKSATQADDLTIYFNTSNGVLAYDGNNFNEVNLNNDTIAVTDIQFFNSFLYIATSNGLLQYSPSKDSVAKVANESFLQIKSLDDQLWLITKNELFTLQNGELRSIYKAVEDETFQCLEINQSITIIGHDKGITAIEKDGTSRTFGTFLNPRKIISFDSSFYILSTDAIFQLTNEKIVRDYQYKTEIKDFYVDEVGKTWFIDNKNVLRINDLTQTKPLFYSDNKFVRGSSFFQEKENNLWTLGSNSLFKTVQNNPFSKLFEENAISVFTGKNSNLLVKNNELLEYSLISDVRRIKIPRSALGFKQYDAFQIGNDWVVSLDKSVYWLTSSDNRLSLIKDGSDFLPLKQLKEDQYLAKNDQGEIFYTDNEFNPSEKLDAIAAAQRIVRENNRLYIFSKNNTISVVDSAGNIESQVSLPDSINLMHIIPAKTGFWYFDKQNVNYINANGELQKLDRDFSRNLTDEKILNIFDDKDENLWISLKNGLLRFPFTITDGKISLQKGVFYNQSDFLFSTYFKSATKDELRRIWFINDMGISLYNPLKETPNLVPPTASIANAFAYHFDKYRNPVDTISLLENRSRIENNSVIVIEPKIINHYNTTKSTFGYRNLSIDQTEQKIKHGEKIILTDLIDGLNIISLRAYNSNGIESKNEYTIDIFVNPPIWKRNWFYLTSALSLLLLGFIGYRTVINVKNSRARELEDELSKGLDDLKKKSHLQVLKAERLKQLNDLISSQKGELEKKNNQIEAQKYELSLTNQQIKKQKDLLEETTTKLASSINYAKRIQNALMSTEIEVKKAFEESFVYFQPRDAVSGDFFWFKKLTNEKGEELLILAAVDCTGHGVPGAIVSVVGMSLLNNITKLKKIYDPGEILTEMNQDIITDLRQDETQVNDGMDMTLITFNTVTKQLYFAGAKNPLMYVENGELIRIKGDKHAIGGQQRGEARIFTTHHLDLTDGIKRTFYLFSDGYQDQFGGEKGFKYLVGNFKKLLLSIHEKDVLDQKTILHEEIQDWKEGYSQTDDILVIGFKL